MKLSREAVLDGLSEISFNLSAVWLGILIIAPGVSGVDLTEYFDLLLRNLPPAIISFIAGTFFLEGSKT